MSDFTASNGIRVHRRDDGGIELFTERGSKYLGGSGSVFTHALGEFVDHMCTTWRAEEDARLGRWRWPENPDYVVYPPSAFRKVTVFRESTGEQHLYARNSPTFADRRETLSDWSAAALAYFDAHPEPKPWHDAKPGELWLLTVDGAECAAFTKPDKGGGFGGVVFEVVGRGPFGRTATAITAGRRIWPEVSE